MKTKLTISATAMKKITHLLTLPTEAGAFGLSRIADPLHILDIAIPHQEVSGVSVSFDDNKIAQYTDEMFVQGWEPCECTRIWIHTHPESIAKPSSTDEQTFQKIFGNYEWSAMVIFPKNGTPYARLKITTPFCVEEEVHITQCPEPNTEFEALVKERIQQLTKPVTTRYSPGIPRDLWTPHQQIFGQETTKTINQNYNQPEPTRQTISHTEFDQAEDELYQQFQDGIITRDEYNEAWNRLYQKVGII